MPTISELIQLQHDNGLTFREMADRASAAGFPVKFQQFDKLSKVPPSQWPRSSEAFRGYAAALDVSERTIVLAFARSFDLDVSESSSLLEVLLPLGTRDLDTGMQQAIAGVVRAAVRARHEDGGTSGDAAPIAGIKTQVLEDEAHVHDVQAGPSPKVSKTRKRGHPTGS